ncbi:MAG: response regulator [Chloroflexales bacterium]|nr:response regulator [Chloroflexales bacterium]
MSISLNVLILEDRPADAELILRELRRAGFAPLWRRVDSEAAFLAELSPDLDLILADYELPQFDARRALELLQWRGLDIPFIIVSGAIGEEEAVAAMRRGAADYLLKDRLARLGTAIEHVLQGRQLRLEHQRSAAQLKESERHHRMLIEALPVAVYITDADGYISLCNEAAEALWGRQVSLGYDRWCGAARLCTPDGTPLPHEQCPMAVALRDGRPIRGAGIVVIRPDGTHVDCLAYPTLIHNAAGELTGAMNVLVGITERRRAEETLEAERAQLAERVEARTAELRIANAELARAARLKDEFLATMSHELRTPLNAIIGHSELLQEGLYGPVTPRQIEALSSIDSSGQHLLALINDILDLSKVEANKLELQFDLVEVDLACQMALHMVAQSAQAKQITLSSLIDPQVKAIRADERRLTQILVNLLSNAVKFTPEGGRVGLEVRGDQGRRLVTFMVWDTGIGIADEHLSRLFQPFSQIDSGLNRQYNGTGLGLSLVLRLAQAHGGSASVESTPEKGSRFAVALPWRVALEESASAPDEAPAAARPLMPAPPSEPAPSKPRPVILLVDDNEAGSQVITDYLDSKGFVVRAAWNGAEAMAQAQAEPPDIVLMDVQMPGMDGLEATRRMRTDVRLRHIPIIAVTALAMAGDRERCMAAGADAYLTKPISLRLLYETITAHLDRREATAPTGKLGATSERTV